MTYDEAIAIWNRNDITEAQRYGLMIGNQTWGDALRQNVPAHMHGGMIRWIIFGVRAGDFQMAILKNDFMDAAGRADDVNQRSLLGYIRFLYNAAPRGSYGDEYNVREWKGMFPRPDEEVAND